MMLRFFILFFSFPLFSDQRKNVRDFHFMQKRDNYIGIPSRTYVA